MGNYDDIMRSFYLTNMLVDVIIIDCNKSTNYTNNIFNNLVSLT